MHRPVRHRAAAPPLALAFASAIALLACGAREANIGPRSLGGASATHTTSVSGLPEATTKGIPRPSGNGREPKLTILNWAGFTAAATFTFDDAQPSHVDYWPALKAQNVPLTFYFNAANRAYPNFDATWRDVVASGGEIGDHTYHHCYENLTGCPGNNAPFASADLEIANNVEYLARRDAITDVRTMAYPFGDANWERLAQVHYFLARGVRPGMVAPNDDSDPFDLPCVVATGGQPASVFSASVDSAHARGRWVIFLFHSILGADGGGANDWYAGESITSIEGAIEHAKSLTDVWIDTVANVGAYWIAQRTLSRTRPTALPSGQAWRWTLPDHFPPGRYLRATIDGGTLSQNGTPLAWDDHGYYEIALDAGSLTWTP